ncbi:hypothetical protein [Yoonia sp.]|uniref:hypothetical protein n=1 Tax=Yoonia sp. TaxID=2212373 RepID=UPI003F6C58AE
MQNLNIAQQGQAATNMAEVLTLPHWQGPVGYRLGGYRPGPTIAVTGHSPVADIVYDRLLRVPTLAWMRGTMILMHMDLTEGHSLHQILGIERGAQIDRVVVLPHLHTKAALDLGYWHVLQVCTHLGMINGRGVRPQPVRKETAKSDS